MEITTEAKVIIIGLIVTVVIIAGSAFLSGQRSSQGEVEPVAQPERLARDDDPALGAQDVKVIVVEFGDFQCPACGALHPVLKQVKEVNAEQSVRFVYRQFPLPQHEYALLAAEASLAAHAQGKFWEYHDLLFENQSQLRRDDLEGYAQQLELDMEAFRSALDEGMYREAVEQDKSDGQAVGVRATPTIFVNDLPYEGRHSVDSIQAAIDAALGG